MTSSYTTRFSGIETAVAIKAPVVASTTANITLSGAQTIDGVAVVADDRVLVKNQTNGAENGIYVASTGAWSRAKDFDGSGDIVKGTQVAVNGGTVAAGYIYAVQTADVSIGTTSIVFSRVGYIADGNFGELADDLTPQLGGPLDTNSHQVRWSKGVDVASATALTLGADGNYFDITGTTTVTSIGTLGIGTVVLLQFDAALTLTHHATDLVLPGGANITTAAGDHAILVEYATGNWRCVSYQVASASVGLGNVVEDTTPQAGGVFEMNGHSLRLVKGADVASASELLLSDDGNFFDVTGTTSITSIESGNGFFALQFDGALTLTHHATDLVLPGGANITTAAGDIALFYEYATGDYRCISYQVAATSPGAGGGGGWVHVDKAEPTSDTSSISFTGLNADGFRHVRLFGLVESSVTTITVQIRASSGTWRNIGKLDPATTNDALFFSFEVMNFDQAQGAVTVGVVSAGTLDANTDRSNAGITGPGGSDECGYVTYSETFDEIRLLSAGSFEGSTADRRSWVVCEGML